MAEGNALAADDGHYATRGLTRPSPSSGSSD
jgi:hypothetical protein